MSDNGPELTRSFLLREIETDRRAERAVIWNAVVALLIVVVLVAVRQLFFV